MRTCSVQVHRHVAPWAWVALLAVLPAVRWADGATSTILAVSVPSILIISLYTLLNACALIFLDIISRLAWQSTGASGAAAGGLAMDDVPAVRRHHRTARSSARL